MTDLTLRKFGRLTILGPSENKHSRGKLWRCLCDCGNKKEVPRSSLTTNNVRSCGCLIREKPSSRKSYGEAAKNRLINSYKSNAKKKNLLFSLKKEEIESLFKSNCYYCASPPLKKAEYKGCYGYYIFNGIDRVDNNKGYIIDNCVSCCSLCNYKKSNKTQEMFYNQISKIYEFKFKKL